jgi:hypothetical protein
VDPPTLFA